jgi:hypothetical protein
LARQVRQVAAALRKVAAPRVDVVRGVRSRAPALAFFASIISFPAGIERCVATPLRKVAGVA